MKKNQLFLKTLIETILEADEETSIDNKATDKGEDPQASDDKTAELAATFQDPSVASFVSKFKDLATDPKVLAILRAGQTDGNPKDEQLKYSTMDISVTNLHPTQNEIGFNESIENVLTDKFGSLKSIFGGQANMGGPIVTYNGKYVIDGHHRWSQVFAVNTKAKMPALNIQGNLEPKEILKVVHAAIAAKIGKVPLVPAKGINLLKGVNEKDVQKAVDEKLSDSAKAIWAENGYKDNKAIAKHITGNLMRMIKNNKPIAGAPARTSMPQTAVGGKEKDKLDALAKGIVNFKDPKPTDVKAEVKTLQERAGLRNRYS